MLPPLNSGRLLNKTNPFLLLKRQGAPGAPADLVLPTTPIYVPSRKRWWVGICDGL